MIGNVLSAISIIVIVIWIIIDYKKIKVEKQLNATYTNCEKRLIELKSFVQSQVDNQEKNVITIEQITDQVLKRLNEDSTKVNHE